MQKRSYGSVRIAFLDRNAAIAELKEDVQKLISKDSRTLAVGLFGSLARGKATPRSDADILIVLKDHPLSRWFDRIPEYASAFQISTLAVELFPYTIEELSHLISHSSFFRTVLRELIPLGGDPQVWKSFQNI